jgi:TolA-binding protein
LICDRALLAGYAAQTRDIQPEHVRKAVAALRGEDAEVSANMAAKTRGWARKAAVISTVAVLAAATAGVAFWPKHAATPPDETLYWRAARATTATDAERDFRALVTTFPTSRRIDDALLRLSELEISRGDRAAAIQHLTQLAQHAPPGIDRTRAGVLIAVAQLDGGDTTSACLHVTPGLGATTGADTALGRQLQTVNKVCEARTAATAVQAGDSAAQPAAKKDSTANALAPRGRSASRP